MSSDSNPTWTQGIPFKESGDAAKEAPVFMNPGPAICVPAPDATKASPAFFPTSVNVPAPFPIQSAPVGRTE